MKLKWMSLLSVVALFMSVHVYAWDCTQWTSNVPGDECYKPPVTAGNSQSQSQGQHQSQSATGITNSTIGSNDGARLSNVGNSANTNTNIAKGGQGGQALNEGNKQTVTVSQSRQAPSLFGGSLIVPQCGTGAGAGASGPGYGAFANVIWTPHDCKLLRVAGALQALGMYTDACEIVIHTDAFLSTYHRFDIAMPVCMNPVLQPVEAPTASIQPVVVNVSYPIPVVSPPVIAPHSPVHKAKKRVRKVCR